MVQATLAADDAHFEGLMRQLLDRFRGPDGAKLLQRRGSLIVCRLAALLGGRRVFRALAAVLADADDLRFVSALVQALNLILLTAPEARHAATPLLNWRNAPDSLPALTKWLTF